MAPKRVAAAAAKAGAQAKGKAKAKAKTVAEKPPACKTSAKRTLLQAFAAGAGSPPQATKVSAGASGADVAALVSTLKDKAWMEALQDEFRKPYFAEIAKFVAEERAQYDVHPPPDLVFNALNTTPLHDIKVVILGQDPYHEPGQAHGLCFSVLPGVRAPPSLKNMYKELVVDIPGFKTPDHGHLVQWAERGVLLLNATLTVRGGSTNANSHAKCGWQKFTDEVIRVINARCRNVVFLLWGGFAQKKGKIIDTSRHKVLECAHPSPLSFRKWHGCKTFSKCNAALKELGRSEIDWSLE